LVPQPTPPNAKQDQSDQRTVVIQVGKDHSLKINQEETNYTEQTLGPRLEDIFKTRAERVVFVRGDADLEYQYVARAIDIAHGAGIDKVGLMTAKMEAGQ
jgi:biopolymer transport protein ExbD